MRQDFAIKDRISVYQAFELTTGRTFLKDCRDSYVRHGARMDFVNLEISESRDDRRGTDQRGIDSTGKVRQISHPGR